MCALAVPNVYSFPMLTGEFCELMLQELDHFERSEMPKGRPNTMNNYGVHQPYKHYLISYTTNRMIHMTLHKQIIASMLPIYDASHHAPIIHQLL